MDAVYPGKHVRNIRDKSNTHIVEGVNADLRHYIPILARHSRCFARKLKTLQRNLDLLVTIAIGWIGLISEKSDERAMVLDLIHISRRIYGTPRFVFYAIADGLFLIAARVGKGIADMLRKKPKTNQLSFWSEHGFSCWAC